jgi:hypothetical protein
MKLTRVKIILLAAVALTNGLFVHAQANNAATDYAKFSAFVTDRNIFDPNRVSHTGYTPRVRTTTRTTTRTRVSNSSPAFSLVGTMSYEKGVFAFFNGNSSDLKKALPVNAKIAGYTVAKIVPGRVLLVSADKKEKLELKVGDVLRQESGKWAVSGTGELPTGTSSAAATGSPAGGDSSAAPSPALGQNDVLKRLMELRKKEEQ